MSPMLRLTEGGSCGSYRRKKVQSKPSPQSWTLPRFASAHVSRTVTVAGESHEAINPILRARKTQGMPASDNSSRLEPSPQTENTATALPRKRSLLPACPSLDTLSQFPPKTMAPGTPFLVEYSKTTILQDLGTYFYYIMFLFLCK